MPRAVVAREIAAASLGLGLQRSSSKAVGGPLPIQRSIPVQRDAAVIDGTPVATYGDLDKWYTERIKRLKAQRDGLKVELICATAEAAALKKQLAGPRRSAGPKSDVRTLLRRWMPHSAYH